MSKVVPRENWVNDNQALLDLQEKYLTSRSQENWEKLYSEVLRVAERVVINKFKHLNFVPTEARVEEVTFETVNAVMKRYKTNPDYKVEKAYITTLMFATLRPLHSPEQRERERQEEKTILVEEFFNSTYEKIDLRIKDPIENIMENNPVAYKVKISAADYYFLTQFAAEKEVSISDLLHDIILFFDISYKKKEAPFYKKRGLVLNKMKSPTD